MNFKNKEYKYRDLSNIFIKNYIFFTILILFLLCTIYGVSNYLIHKMVFTNKVDMLIEKAPEMSDDEFKYLKAEHYLGTDGKFVLLNENGKTLYTNYPSWFSDYLPSELACIPDYSEKVYTSMIKLESENGELLYLITKGYHDKTEKHHITDYIFLNKQYDIVYSTILTERKSLTEKEIKFLSGDTYNEKDIFKYSYKNLQGDNRTLIFMTKMSSEDKYIKIYHILNYIWVLFILFCFFIATLLFIKRMSRKIKNLLTPLNHAIIGFLNGSCNHLNQYTAPVEFLEIANNLDNLIERLIKSEWENNRLNNSRQRLLADISHDLKTPLTVITGYAAALRDGLVSQEEQAQYLNAICEKTKHITELLSTFHEYSKLEHPDFPVYLQLSNICDIVQIYLANKYNEIDLSGFILDINIPDDVIMCNIDSKLFCRGIDNIINNSIKYNPKGTTIRLAIVNEQSTVKIIIGDTGVGVSSELAEHIFESFSTGDDARGGNHGSGLGLAICEKIILVHHGKINLKYPPDKGYNTQFEITMPVVTNNNHFV